MRYQGSCHCGKVKIEFEGEFGAAVACNCSICARKGALLWAMPRSDLSLTADEADLGAYTFNDNAIRHRFCRTCGIHPFAEDVAAGGSAYVNIRCLEGVDPDALELIRFDGASM
jgi:hypothetical protein